MDGVNDDIYVLCEDKESLHQEETGLTDRTR